MNITYYLKYSTEYAIDEFDNKLFDLFDQKFEKAVLLWRKKPKRKNGFRGILSVAT